MPEHSQVLVQMDGSTIPGLVLKWRRERTEALVTYEVDGRVETQWVPLARITLR